jgi:hypothetical protein
MGKQNDMTIPIGSACGPHGVIWQDGTCLPAGIINPDPIAVWIFETGTPLLSAVIVAFLIYKSIQQKTLTWSILIALASASCWWLESNGDWSQHLLYSPVLSHYGLSWPYTSPHNPNYMPITYALYWWAHAWAILKLVAWVQQRYFPNLTLGQGILLFSIPFTWAWNIVIEGPATWAGLWTYDPPIGMAIEWARGTYWPMLWPSLLMVGWINLIAWMVKLPEEQGELNRIERFFRLGVLLAKPGWSRGESSVANPMLGTAKFQLVRLLCWVLFFNVTFALTLNLPLFLMRMVFGFHSEYLP